MEIGKQNPVLERQNGILSHKVVHSTFWVAASSIFGHVLYFLRTIVLIRLLSPIDFGLMGIAKVVLDMLNKFSETGISMAFVQRKDVSGSTLNTAWIMTVIRGIVLFTLLYVFSPVISRFYNNQSLSPILKFISLSFLFSGLTSAGVFLFIKELNFKNKVFFEQANAISAAIVSVILAIIFKNVWALVIGYVVGVIVGFLFSYHLHPFRPSLKFNLNVAKGLLNFGKYVFGSGIILFFILRGPDALIGKILGLNALGFYVVAFSIANTPTTSVTHFVSQIAFPAYAKLQDDLPKLREGYLKVTRLVVFLSAPIAGGIFMLIPEFVQIFLGIKWIPIILPVKILCIFGFFRSIYSTISPVFYGIGRPDIEFKVTCLNLTVLAIVLYPLTAKMGIVGTSIAFSLMSVVCVIVMTAIVYKLIQLQSEKVKFFKVLFFPLAGTVLMSLSIFIIKFIFSNSLMMAFSMSILMGVVIYILVLYLLDRYFRYGLIDTIRFAVISYRRR